MTSAIETWSRRIARRRGALLWLAVAFMLLAGSDRLSEQTWRLVYDPGPDGAIDLRSQLDTTQRWFAGERVYGADQITHNHPPATYVLLWPLLGWPLLDAARLLWAIATIPALACLAWIAVRYSGARTIAERTVAALTPIAMYATAITIGNGQLTLHVLAALVAGVVVLARGEPGLGRDAAAAALVTVALAKPTVSAPFFWAVLFVPGRLRPAVLVCLMYAALTAFAAAFQERDTLALLAAWLERGTASAGRGAVTGGYANVQSWLAAAGLEAWNGKAALAMLAALGIWTYLHRRADVWILLGVAAVVARLWTYHRIYDDALLLVPMIALARLASGMTAASPQPTVSQRGAAACVLALAWLASQTPARFHSAGPPYELLFNSAQTVVWITVIAYLLTAASRARATRASTSEYAAAA